jgi:hypothetical protein
VARTHAAAVGCGDVVVIAGGTLPGKSSVKGFASVDVRVARAKPETERALRNLLMGGKPQPTVGGCTYKLEIQLIHSA